MHKKKAMVLVFSSFISVSLLAGDITFCNQTNNVNYFYSKPTPITFHILDHAGKKLAEKSKLNGLVLKPGQKIKINTDLLPSLYAGKMLEATYNNYYDKLVVGVDYPNGLDVGVEKLKTDSTDDPNIVPDISIEYNKRMKVKNVNFIYANTFA